MKKYLFALIMTSIASASVTYFAPNLRTLTYGLFVVGFGGLLYFGFRYADKKQRRLVVGGALILTLLALYKLFNSLG